MTNTNDDPRAPMPEDPTAAKSAGRSRWLRYLRTIGKSVVTGAASAAGGSAITYVVLWRQSH
ncbi:hypothetical protein GCM10010347_66220 [Streptomyces cirratus]|uniref:Uncharacterized protein n=1 Tax=Streptomyces cirratus TaxID=68187 RepID=A0ABQ3F5P8_9ACTN|nr:hypothetical protein GCM10010347_66220 [Streptomyces cirratus]